MIRQIPKRLNREPLIESLWEIRFSSTSAFVEKLLPGLLFQEFANESPIAESLPSADLPENLRRADPNLRYIPTVRLTFAPYTIQVGEHIISLSCSRPYSGWKVFGEKIRKLSSVLQKTSLITHPERFSMKYIDILPTDIAPTIEALNAVMSLAGHDVGASPVVFRTERIDDTLVHIIQIVSPAQAQLLNGDHISGILVETDTVCINQTVDFWQNLTNELQRVHDANKKMFFDLLTDETIKRLEPEY
jgi:uncharacterized protein (TIGR04255 family)